MAGFKNRTVLTDKHKIYKRRLWVSPSMAESCTQMDERTLFKNIFISLSNGAEQQLGCLTLLHQHLTNKSENIKIFGKIFVVKSNIDAFDMKFLLNSIVTT